MKTSRCCFALALSVAFAGATPTMSQTIMTGEQIEPTEQQCLAALENGRSIPFSGADSRWRAETYVFHRGTVFLIIVQGGTISCSAWEL